MPTADQAHLSGEAGRRVTAEHEVRDEAYELVRETEKHGDGSCQIAPDDPRAMQPDSAKERYAQPAPEATNRTDGAGVTAHLYGGLVARQTRLALAAVPARTDPLIGVPAYHDENLGHHAWAETVPDAVRGVRLGLSQDPVRQRFGVALYVDFAATGADWRAYRDGWVSAPR